MGQTKILGQQVPFRTKFLKFEILKPGNPG